MNYFAPLLLLFLTIAAASNDGTKPPETQPPTADIVPVSAPDIYPDDSSPINGSVMVRILSNSRNCDLYFTRDGSRPTTASEKYRWPIRIFLPGVHTIKAFCKADTNMMGDSAVVYRTYTILPSAVAVPQAVPMPAVFRGRVVLTLVAANRTSIWYVVDNPDPQHHSWLQFEAKHPLVFDSPGEHLVQAFARDDSKRESPVARYRYIITPPLVYDVSSECDGCDGKPTVGEYFTVWLQNVREGAKLMLVITPQGCERNNHMLDDTTILKAHDRTIHFQYRTFADPGRVYVCIDEGNGFSLVRHRGTEEQYFELQTAVRKHVRPSSTAPYVTQGADRTEGTSAYTFLILWIACGAMIVFVMRVYGCRCLSANSASKGDTEMS